MKVLFTHSYFLNFDPKQLQAGSPYPPLATLYAAALLREKGYEVKLHDIQFATSADEITASLNNFKPDIFVIYDDGFNYLTKMCLTNMREAAFKMQQLAKEKGCKVIVSSSDATDHSEQYLEKGADFIIIGEGEQTLLELSNEIKTKGTNFESITGLHFYKNEQLIKTPKREVKKNLDELPLPAWDLVDITPYKNMWLQKQGYFSINMVTTRGCPYKCNWCAKPIYGNRYNSHSPENIVTIIEQLQQKFGFEHIWFADDIFGLKPDWLKKFAELVTERKLKFRYTIQSRADLLQGDEAKWLAQSGCEKVWMGAESGSQKVLDAMDKGIKVEEIYNAAKNLKQNTIKPCLFLQFGYPGEELNDIALTLKMVKDVLPHDIGISVSYPLPGTKFYENVKAELKNKTNWTDSDDLHLMFKNKYSAEFYKQLHRFIHKNYRKYQSAHLMKNWSNANALQDYKRMALYPYYSISASRERKKLLALQPDAGSHI